MVTTVNNLALSSLKANNTSNGAFYKIDGKTSTSTYNLSSNSSNPSTSPYTVSPSASPISLQNDENSATITSKSNNLGHKNHAIDTSQFINNGNSSSNNTTQNKVSTVYIRGVPVISLLIDGKERLCLAQISNTLLKRYSYNEIHNRRVALGINCIQCTPVQLEILRRTGAMPISSRRCGMITKRESERLVKSFLEDNKPPILPDNFAFNVYHKCGWGCRGVFYPSRYNSSRAKCIRCFYCDLFYSPNKFIFHAHNTPDAKYIQPDTANFNSWRRHLMLINPNGDDHLANAWEDVKAIFNGGTRKRISSLNNSNSGLSSSSSRSVSPVMERVDVDGDSESDNILNINNEKATTADEFIETKSYSPTSVLSNDCKNETQNSLLKTENTTNMITSPFEMKNLAKSKVDLDFLRKKLQTDKPAKLTNEILNVNPTTRSKSSAFTSYGGKIETTSTDTPQIYSGLNETSKIKYSSLENPYHNSNFAIDSKACKTNYKDLLNNSYLFGIQNLQSSYPKYNHPTIKFDNRSNNMTFTNQISSATKKNLNDSNTNNQLYPSAFSQFMAAAAAAAAVSQNYIPTLPSPCSNMKEHNFPYHIEQHQQHTTEQPQQQQQQHNLFSVWNHLNTFEQFKLHNRQATIQGYLSNNHNLTNFENLFNKSYLPSFGLFSQSNASKSQQVDDEQDSEETKTIKRSKTSHTTKLLSSADIDKNNTSKKFTEENNFENNKPASNYENDESDSTKIEICSTD